MRGVLIAICLGFLLTSGCGHAQVRSPTPTPDGKAASAAPLDPDRFGESTSFRVEKSALRSGGVPAKQLTKLDASAFRYSRMLARQFESRTCWAFRDLRWHLPVVAVHGDLHVEQFVVTSDAHGIEDFDQAGYGPSVVDLVRYAASLELACRESSWPCDSTRAINRYFAAYRASLDKAPNGWRVPAVVERLRLKAPQGRPAWLEWVDAQMVPLSPTDDAVTHKGWTTFTDLQTAVHPERPTDFFEIERAGELRIGVGSAVERKILFRIRGPSADPVDDVVLEARGGEAPSTAGCVWRPAHGGALHVLTFTALLGRRMPEVYGYADLVDNLASRPFWVQSWHPGYVEVALSDIQSQEQLEELAEDAARQLGGYFWRFEDPLRGYQRYAQLHAFDIVRDRAIKLARELAREVVVEWENFRKAP